MSEDEPRKALFHELRTQYHAKLLGSILYADGQGVPSIADGDSVGSVRIARGILDRLRLTTGVKESATPAARLAGQRAGREFEKQTADFIGMCFRRLEHLRPGTWHVTYAGSQGITQFEQYSHIFELNQAVLDNPSLAVILGSDYVIKPDIVVFRDTESDEAINDREFLVDGEVTKLASLRRANGGKSLLHASISCKWTLRSDRAQNARSEALNLMRIRKGRAPHILCVTGEPTPARLASIALGTGDIDCVYHFALTELMETLAAADTDSSAEEMLRIMVDGRRLKDIADIPLDLAI
jgi:NgoMIV restriction enzyme